VTWPILVVEDDHDIREELASIFTARGFRSFAAANGREAIDMVEQLGVKPAAILLDLAMPVMDGMEFLDRQGESPLLSGVPVLVMTAYQVGNRKFPSTVRAVFDKPLALGSLLRKIQDVVSNPKR
jgi:CheY-like chemotaxis protein